jgi:hypothetical protein
LTEPPQPDHRRTGRLERLRAELREANGLVTVGRLNEAVQVIGEVVDEIREDMRQFERWQWTMKGAALIVPLVLAMLSWWILDLKRELDTKVSTETRLEMLAAINTRLDAIDRHIEANDTRLERLQAIFSPPLSPYRAPRE